MKKNFLILNQPSLIALLFAVLTYASSAHSLELPHIKMHANGTVYSATAYFSSANDQENETNSVEETEYSDLKRVYLNNIDKAEECAPAWRRACHEQCNGEYGYFCFWGDVCEPLKHGCEHAST